MNQLSKNSENFPRKFVDKNFIFHRNVNFKNFLFNGNFSNENFQQRNSHPFETTHQQSSQFEKNSHFPIFLNGHCEIENSRTAKKLKTRSRPTNYVRKILSRSDKDDIIHSRQPLFHVFPSDFFHFFCFLSWFSFYFVFVLKEFPHTSFTFSVIVCAVGVWASLRICNQIVHKNMIFLLLLVWFFISSDWID